MITNSEDELNGPTIQLKGGWVPEDQWVMTTIQLENILNKMSLSR